MEKINYCNEIRILLAKIENITKKRATDISELDLANIQDRVDTIWATLDYIEEDLKGE